jgi:hypothetical protein
VCVGGGGHESVRTTRIQYSLHPHTHNTHTHTERERERERQFQQHTRGDARTHHGGVLHHQVIGDSEAVAHALQQHLPPHLEPVDLGHVLRAVVWLCVCACWLVGGEGLSLVGGVGGGVLLGC